MKATKILYGMYGDDDILMNAVKTLRSQGIKINEVYTPFPVHGLDKALGLKETKIDVTAFVFGVYGLLLACLLTWYTMNYDWQQNIGGKPSFTWMENMPAFVPIIFEITVFCAAHLMSLAYLYKCGLFPGQNAKNPDPRTTDDKFLIEFYASEQNDFNKIQEILISTGVEEINLKEIENEI